ncbi:MAG: MBL fold metallo-hydrolase [Candidatus Omnitrophica bacterium]|nr:MBL fold metallo-hydrolase [Candidatus Omnitrophota bacterium]
MVKREALEKQAQGPFLKFLGTAGARFVMIKQLRASGGIWVYDGRAHILIDPGPGSIVRCAASRPRLDPSRLDAIILTHRHLDHAGDINVMIEAMTEGGFKKRGAVFCPSDAVGKDTVILDYARNFPERIEVIGAQRSYEAGGFTFRTSMPHMHPVETYGLKFTLNKTTVSLVADTRYFPELSGFYRTDVLIVPVVFPEPRAGIDHLSVPEAAELIKRCAPRKAVLTHFGMTMLKVRPVLVAERLSKELRIEVVAAYDGMKLVF